MSNVVPPSGNSFFSFNLNQNNYDDAANQWPASFTFAAARLWDTGVTWKDIEAQQGVYTFTELDKQINLSIARGITDILYTAGKVPTFYGGGTAFNNPPSDVDSGNANYAAFVRALANHVRSTFPAITFSYEEWNEPNLASNWTGTAVQLLEMSNTAYGILHPLGYKVASPSGSGGTAIGNFILSYLTACNGTYPFDIFAYHAYLQNGNADPSSGMDLILNDIKVKKTSGFPGMANMDTWFTEGSWGQDANYTPVMTDTQKANYLTVQYAKIQAAGGQAARVKRYYWYSLNNSHGFGVLATGIPVVLNSAGLAFQSLAAQQPAQPTSLQAVTK